MALIDPHNLVLHGSVLYRMPRDLHALPASGPWAQEGQGVPPADWRARQRVPGAVMPPIGGPVEVNGQSYPAEARTGMGIGTSLDPARGCDAQLNAIQAAFAAGR